MTALSGLCDFLIQYEFKEQQQNVISDKQWITFSVHINKTIYHMGGAVKQSNSMPLRIISLVSFLMNCCI